MCSRRWIAPLAVFTYQQPCLRTHTYGTREVGGMAGCWYRFIFPITALYPLGSTLSREHRRGFITVCDSRCGAVCTLWIHCPPGSGFIQSSHPFFPSAYLVHRHSFLYGDSVLHNAPRATDQILCHGAGSAFKKICFYMLGALLLKIQILSEMQMQLKKKKKVGRLTMGQENQRSTGVIQNN